MKLRALVISTVLVASACSGSDDSVSETATSTLPATTLPTATQVATTEAITTAAAAATTTGANTTVPRSSPTWSRVAHDEEVFGGEGHPGMMSVTVGGPGLVAVGSDGSAGAGVAAVWTSPDGITWLRVPHDEAVFGGDGTQRMRGVTAGGPGLVAVGDAQSNGAAVWTSPDGISWSRVLHDEAVFGSQRMWSVTVGGPGLVAVGDDGSSDDLFDAAVWTSPDGITWSRVPHDEVVFGGEGRMQAMLSVTVGGPGVVAVWRSPRLGNN